MSHLQAAALAMLVWYTTTFRMETPLKGNLEDMSPAETLESCWQFHPSYHTQSSTVLLSVRQPLHSDPPFSDTSVATHGDEGIFPHDSVKWRVFKNGESSDFKGQTSGKETDTVQFCWVTLSWKKVGTLFMTLFVTLSNVTVTGKAYW